jgi:Tfp pilus assembly protein PilN
MQSVNLIPMPRRENRYRRLRIRGWVLGTAVYLAVLIGACVVVRAAWSGSDRAVADELAAVQKQIAVTNQQLSIIQPELLEARSQLEASRAVAIQPDWSVLMMLLSRLRGEAIVFEQLKLQPLKIEAPKPTAAKPGAPPRPGSAAAKKAKEDDARKPMHYGLQLTGLGQSQQEVSDFVLRVEQSGLFDSVKLVETTRFPFGAAHAIGFKIECAMGEKREGEHVQP